MSNVYYDPEHFELTPVGEIDWSDGCYQFDLTVIWKHADGRLFYAEDSGCSCPSPFEGVRGIPDLTPITSAADFHKHLKSRKTESDGWGNATDDDVLRLASKVREALA